MKVKGIDLLEHEGDWLRGIKEPGNRMRMSRVVQTTAMKYYGNVRVETEFGNFILWEKKEYEVELA